MVQTDIIPRPASNDRSSNRQPRTRHFLRAKAWDTKRERLVQEVATGKSKEEAAKLAGLSPDHLPRMEARIPEFKAKLEEAERLGALRRAEAQGLIDGELPRIAQELMDIGQRAKDVKLRAEVDYKLLKGRGVLEGEGVNVAVGVNVITGDDMARAYREMKKALVDGNGNTDPK